MPKVLLSIIALLLLPAAVFASGFQLTTIGELNVTGTQSAEWWYSSPNPTLQGTAAASAPVEVIVGGVSQTVTADTSGNWSAPITASEGDHSVTLTSGGNSIVFTLHIGVVPEGVGAPVASDLPVVGNVAPTLLITLAGIGVVLGGLFLKKSALIRG